MRTFATKAGHEYFSVDPEDEIALDVQKSPLKLPQEMASLTEAREIIERYSEWFNAPLSIVQITKDIPVFSFLNFLGSVLDRAVENWCVDFWGQVASMEAARVFDDEWKYCRSELLIESGLGMFWFYQTEEGIVLRASQGRTANATLQLSVEIPCDLLGQSTASIFEYALSANPTYFGTDNDSVSDFVDDGCNL